MAPRAPSPTRITLSRLDLDRLIAHDGYPAITLMLPTHLGGRELKQDRVRLRTLAQRAVEHLVEAGMRRTEAEHFLEPARALSAHDPFWQDHSRGLAAFLAKHVFEVMRLPISSSEEMVVGRRFHVRHLLPALEEDASFNILTLTAREARLFRADGGKLIEVRDEIFPAEWHEAPREWSDPRIAMAELRRLRNHAKPDAGAELIGKFHAFLSDVAKGAGRITNGYDVPLILVATEELQGHFRNVAKLRNLLAEGIEEDPAVFSTEALRQRGHALLRPRLAASSNAVRERFEKIFGQGQARASIDLKEVLDAARNGRVDTLFVADDTHVWGRLEGAANGVSERNEPAVGDEDLLDVAAAETWRNGGAVQVLPRSETPFGKPVAALLRW